MKVKTRSCHLDKQTEIAKQSIHTSIAHGGPAATVELTFRDLSLPNTPILISESAWELQNWICLDLKVISGEA